MDKTMEDYPPSQDAPPTYVQEQQRFAQTPQGYSQDGGYTQGYGATTDRTAIIIQPQQPTYVTVQQEPLPDAGGMMCCACLVFWCCCWPLGLAAFICAVQANSSRSHIEAQEKLSTARQLSIAGMICGIIFITTAIILNLTVFSQQYPDQ